MRVGAETVSYGQQDRVATTASHLELAWLREPLAVEAAVLDWLIARNGSGRPPVGMAKLLTLMVGLHQHGLPFDRRAVAAALSLNLYTQDSMLRVALDRGHVTAACYVPSHGLCAVVNAARARQAAWP